MQDKRNNEETVPLWVMRPSMPPLEEFRAYLEKIWESRRLSNGGDLHREFEAALCEYLGAGCVSLFANGSLALMIALKALGLKGEVVTTPFTSVATLQAIYWNNLVPVFADISEADFTMDVRSMEEAITPATCAVLPVHVFGNPCDTKEIARLSGKYDVRVVYDAAHCFGVKVDGTSLCNQGDLSVLSFHATKVFNTFEGGALVCKDPALKKYVDALKNSGIDENYEVAGYGMNAKMNELQAAYGLMQLKYVDQVMDQRRRVFIKYRELLKDLKGIRLPADHDGVTSNYSYFPVIIDPLEFGATRDEVAGHLSQRNIHARKYFSPLVSDYREFSRFRTRELPVARKIASQVLCLPLFHDLSQEGVQFVAETLSELHRSA
jgi:dTDP-4-amino-4,6-dideoxygalactose transaminase